MKILSRYLRFAVVVSLPIAFTLFGCGAVGVEDEPVSDFYFEVDLNGQAWEGSRVLWSQASLFQRRGESVLITIGQGYYSENRQWDELFSISVLSPKVGASPIITGQDTLSSYDLNVGAHFTELHGDQPVGDYTTPDVGPNFVEQAGLLRLERLDLETGVAEGAFEALLVVTPRHATGRNAELRRRPDTLRFTNGRFRLPITVYEE